MDAQAIAAANVPVLCFDTCSILDIMRDPTRETAKPHNRQAAIDLVVAAESRRIVCLMAAQVAIEFAEHDQAVQDEAERNLKKVREQIMRINVLSGIFGAPGVIDLNHLDDHVSRARLVVQRLLTHFHPVKPGASTPARAFARMNAGRAPARRGKESSKDCLVYETYIEAVSALRNAGTTQPIVFLSSNTSEYLGEGRQLNPEIAVEFGSLALTYAPSLGAAKHALGL